MASNLKQIRAEIAELKPEITRVYESLRPVAEIEADLRAYIKELAAPYTRFISTAASAIAHGAKLGELVGNLPPSQLPVHAFGIALAAHGIDEIISQVRQQAERDDRGAMRLSTAEREDRLDELHQKLYRLELAEEAALNGAERRPGANSACVLSIPLAAAIEIDERNQNNYLVHGKW